MKKTVFIKVLVIALFSVNLYARNDYYPQDFQDQFNNIDKAIDLSPEEVKTAVFEVMDRPHQKNAVGPDTLGCSAAKNCYSHQSIGYKEARRQLFGNLHLEQDQDGYFIEDVYCQKKITRDITNIGPRVIPNNNILNAEHTWPQSRFNRRFGTDLQKSDLHHLFPTDSRANSKRGNFEFAEVDGKAIEDCMESKSGRSNDGMGGSSRFEPPKEHKGNVARALFYFSVRYKLPLSESEQSYLKEWHEIDPVDEQEMKRNDEIHQIQGNRNPFIDYPELVDHIDNF